MYLFVSLSVLSLPEYTHERAYSLPTPSDNTNRLL